MQQGDAVTYNAHPDWGTGTVLRREPNGLWKVRFALIEPVYEGEFHEGELTPEKLEKVAA